MSSLIRLLRLPFLAALCLPVTVSAQADNSWVTREQEALWVGVFAEEALTSRTAAWFDASWRRMGLGERPQQLLLRPGVLFTLAPGVKIGGGYSYIATAPYGQLPIAAPTREHRGWQDLQLTHQAGRVGVSHRFRLEQRWIHQRLASGAGPTTYANRFRYRARGTLPIGGLKVNHQPVYGFAWDELLMPIGGKAQLFTLGQNRATVGAGLSLSRTVKAELGYMNLYNAFASRRANEVNHTIWLSLHYAGNHLRR